MQWSIMEPQKGVILIQATTWRIPTGLLCEINQTKEKGKLCIIALSSQIHGDRQCSRCQGWRREKELQGMGAEFSTARWKDTRDRLHHGVDVLRTTKLYTSKWVKINVHFRCTKLEISLSKPKGWNSVIYNSEVIELSELAQAKKDKYGMISFMWDPKKWKNDLIEVRSRMAVSWGWKPRVNRRTFQLTNR